MNRLLRSKWLSATLVPFLFVAGVSVTSLSLTGCDGDDDIGEQVEDIGEEMGDAAEEMGDEIEETTD